MNIIKRVIKKLFCKSQLDFRDRSKLMVERIRQGGGIVGDNVNIIDSEFDTFAYYLIKIGNNVTITGAKILNHDASMVSAMVCVKIGTVEIGDNVFIARGCIVLPGIKIGNNVIVGSSAVVSKDIPDNVVCVGNPLRILCSYDEFINKQKERMEKFPVFKSGKELNENKDKQKEIWLSRIAYIKK